MPEAAVEHDGHPGLRERRRVVDQERVTRAELRPVFVRCELAPEQTDHPLVEREMNRGAVLHQRAREAALAGAHGPAQQEHSSRAAAHAQTTGGGASLPVSNTPSAARNRTYSQAMVAK